MINKWKIGAVLLFIIGIAFLSPDGTLFRLDGGSICVIYLGYALLYVDRLNSINSMQLNRFQSLKQFYTQSVKENLIATFLYLAHYCFWGILFMLIMAQKIRVTKKEFLLFVLLTYLNLQLLSLLGTICRLLFGRVKSIICMYVFVIASLIMAITRVDIATPFIFGSTIGLELRETLSVNTIKQYLLFGIVLLFLFLLSKRKDRLA